MKGILSLVVILSLFSAQAADYKFPKIQLPNGDWIHNASLKSEDAATVTFWSDEGIFRIKKTDLRPEIAKLFPYDAEVARQEVAREQEQLQIIQKAQALTNENLTLFNEHAVRLVIGSVRGQATNGVYVTATLLGDYQEIRRPSRNFFGKPGLMVSDSVQKRSYLGDVFISGATLEQVANPDKPIYACYIGTAQANESNGIASRDLTLPRYTVIKSEAGDFYRNQAALTAAQGQ